MSEPIEVLTEELLRAEAVFQTFGFATAAFVEIEESSGATLHFRRNGFHWGLFVRATPSDTETEIARAPKRLRIAAGRALGKLWTELMAAEEHEERAIAEATEEVRRFRAEFGHAAGEES